MKKICLLVFLLSLIFGMQVHAAHPSRVIDDADLLFDYEEEYLIRMLDEKSESLDFDIVVVTTNTTGGKSSMVYADDYFDYNGYGMGTNYDGALLLINMGAREWYISTTGYGMEALSDRELDKIGEVAAHYLSNGNYLSAFETFATMVEECVLDEKDAEILTVKEAFLIGLISLAGGGILAFIPVTVMKKKLNNVRKKNEASDYVQRDRIMMTEQRDMFLYRNITRRRKPQNNSSGSGGHVGSSGRSHGGRGGRF